MYTLKSIIALSAAFALARARTIEVTATSDNTFDPDTIEDAAEGDIIEFHFARGNHSVVTGEYDWPCSPVELQTGFFSGFVDTDDDTADQVFRVTLNNTDPIVFYSSVDDQCPSGMVGIINPNDEVSLDDYRERAGELSSGVSPGGDTFGGDLVEDDGNDDDSNDDSNDENNDDSNDDSNDNSSDDSSDDNGDDSESSDDNAEDAAGVFQVPTLSLLGVVGLAFFLA